MKKIISIDGGGIRGIVPAIVLQRVEEELQDHLFNHVDLVAGTSTGGIIAGGIATGMPMQNVVKFYLQDGPSIFGEVAFIDSIKSVFGYFGGKFEITDLRDKLKERLGDVTLGDLYIDYLSTAYNMTDGKPRFFSRSQEGKLKLADVIAGGSAAPTYFDPHTIGGKEYIDGGVFCSSPAMSAFAEIKTLHNVRAESIFMVSLGCGNRLHGYSSAKRWFKAKWVKPLIDIMMGADAGIAHHQLVQTYKSVGHSENYYRINSKLPDYVHPDMADASPKNMKALVKFANHLADKNSRKIKIIAERLKK